MTAAFIVLNAVHQLSSGEGSRMICYMQLIISLDILILVFFGAGILQALPKVGVWFRLVEALTFLGVTIALANKGYSNMAAVHGLLTLVYSFLFQREWKMAPSEAIELNVSGITIPHFFAHGQIKWEHIRKVAAGYDSIKIETDRDKNVQFRLRNNLKIEELEQINDFCSFHSQLSR